VTPETRIGALLDAYPEVSDFLIGLAPQFAALKNPLLRRTVARVATVQQAAQIAGMPPGDLVVALREHLGQEIGETGSLETGPADGERPEWAGTDQFLAEVDADALLASGLTPIVEVKRRLAEAGAGDMVRLTASFRPAPLIDALRKQGFQVHAEPNAAGDGWLVLVRMD